MTHDLTTGFRPYLLLTLLCAVLFLPGIATIPPTDRDESRFMQATKQMIETDNFVDIRFQNEPRNKKPVGIYWLQALAVRASGVDDLATAWPYRVPSVLAAWLGVLVTCATGKKLFSPRAGLMAGAALATCLVVVSEAHLAKTDAALLAASAVAFAALAQIYIADTETASRRAAFAFWFAFGIGVLLKGPIIVLVIGAAVLALCAADRDMQWLRKLHPMPGVLLAAIVVLPWLAAIALKGQSSFIDDTVRQDILPKLVGGQEGHGAWPGTHLVSALATAWPWSALAPFVLIAAWRQRTQPAMRVCLAWLLPGWLIFELIPTKLPHYTLPLFPAFVVLTAAALDDMSGIRAWVAGRAGLLYRVFFLAVSAALAGGILYLSIHYGDGISAGGILAALAALGAGVFAAVALHRAPGPRIAANLAIASTIFAATLGLGVVPQLSALAVTARITDAVLQHSGPHHGVVAFGGFHEPSAIFLLGTQTLLTDVPGAAKHLLTAPDALAVVPVDDLSTAESALESEGRHLDRIAEIDGYEYSRGKPVRLELIAATSAVSP